MIDAPDPGFFQWSVASVPHPGENSTGDIAVVEQHGDSYLLATIDGLGHGPEAAAAAQVASDTIRLNVAESLDDLLVLCHQAMQTTRGAAITLARITSAGSLSWVGVGNVDAFLIRPSPAGVVPIDSPVLSGGIVGFDLPHVSVRTTELRLGDMIAIVTDGVSRDFLGNLRAGQDIDSLAAEIVERCSKGTDDALALIGRFRGRDDRNP